MATYGYTRVSSERQVKKGSSLASQSEAITEYAQKHDLGEVQIFVDPGVSCKREDFSAREAASALAAAVQPGDHIVITKIDRAFRNLVDFLTWFDTWACQGITLHVLNFHGNTLDPRTAIGKMMIRMLASIAEFDNDLRSERTRESHAWKRMHGFLRTAPPLGFMKGPREQGGFRLVPCPRERAFMSQCLQWHQEGMTYEDIARYCRKHKISALRARKTFKGKYDGVVSEYADIRDMQIRKYILTELCLQEAEQITNQEEDE